MVGCIVRTMVSGKSVFHSFSSFHDPGVFDTFGVSMNSGSKDLHISCIALSRFVPFKPWLLGSTYPSVICINIWHSNENSPFLDAFACWNHRFLAGKFWYITRGQLFHLSFEDWLQPYNPIQQLENVPSSLSASLTLPETNSSPLKIGHPQRKLVFQPSIFRGEDVSFREG